MKKLKLLFSISLCFSLILLIVDYSNVEAQPSAPGFDVQTYTNVSQPMSLSFDPSGILYAGNGNNYIGIYRIDVGGSPAREYGDTPLHDPDAVVFDSVGTISGQPGSVLVGGIDGPASPNGYLAAILPDESTITIFGPGFGLVNPTDMIFDTEGRLLIADAFAAKVFFSDDGVNLNTLIGNVYLAGELALDEIGNIYLSRHMGSISKYSSNGTLLNGSFVTGLDIHGMDFGPSSPPWDGHLFAVSYEGKLYRIDELGAVTEIGIGFHNPPGDPDLEFGPDGAMYVSDSGNNVIYRIDAKVLIKINEFVTFEPDPATYNFSPNSVGCQTGSVGKFTFDATLSNTSEKELSNLHVEVDELTNDNLILTGEGLKGEGDIFKIATDKKRDQGRIFGTGGALELETDEWSQSITTGISGQLTEIMIQFHYGVPEQPPALNLSIFDGGNPISGSALFSEQLFITLTDPDDPSLFTWDLSRAGLFFNVGDVFSFVLQADGVGYNIAGNDPPGYVGGELFKNGIPYTELSDIAFITYVVPVPLQTSVVLNPDENVDVPFTVCLQDKKPFRFFVNVLGSMEIVWANNLLSNHGAETGSLEGWITDDPEIVIASKEQSSSSGLVVPNSGQWFFNMGSAAVGPSNEVITRILYQDVNVNSHSFKIDNGFAKFRGDTYFQTENVASLPGADYAKMTIYFLDQFDDEIDKVSTGLIQSPNIIWEQASLQGMLPVGTRKIRLELLGEKHESIYINAFFDDINLQIGYSSE